jgi:aryl-alcohol dehydrogenase-like predicted oxidoreductase
MNTRKLGWTDLNLTTLGLGTWAIGGGDWLFGWGPQDDKESLDAIVRGIERGINWIDTAPAYGLGHGEEVVGQALKKLGKKPIVATKCGISWDKNRVNYRSLSAETIRQEVDASLKRLGIDVIDLYQVHWPDPDAALEAAWTEIAKAVKAGKVRYAGVCNCNIAQLKRIQPIHPVASLQPPYSMIERAAEESGLLDYCRTQNIGVVAYSPMQKGILTGKYTRELIAALPKNDHRRNDPNFKEPRFSANMELVDKLTAVAQKNNCTTAQAAIAWVLRLPAVTSAIVGVRNTQQVDEVIPAGDLNLSPADIKTIDAAVAKHKITLA